MDGALPVLIGSPCSTDSVGIVPDNRHDKSAGALTVLTYLNEGVVHARPYDGQGLPLCAPRVHGHFLR